MGQVSDGPSLACGGRVFEISSLRHCLEEVEAQVAVPLRESGSPLSYLILRPLVLHFPQQG